MRKTGLAIVTGFAGVPWSSSKGEVTGPVHGSGTTRNLPTAKLR